MMGCKESCDFLRGYFAPERFIQRVLNIQYLQPTTISGTTNIRIESDARNKLRRLKAVT